MNSNTIAKVKASDCMGCGLCVNVCPQKCITMQQDEEGFFAPSIDFNLCIECGVCLRSCPATSVSDALFYDNERKYYAAIAKDQDMLSQCSSGGVFGILAKHFIDAGGYVCGCVYNDKMEAIHIMTNEQDDVIKMFGSKYVQSRAYECFMKVKQALEDDSPVLFSGTACQISALRTFLKKEYSKLICAEVLCHGVPSPGLFSRYISYLENKLKGKILDVQFRSKKCGGWGSEHRMRILYEKNGRAKEYRPFLPAYFSAFFYGLNLRESCYSCKFACEKRVADITLADFWGSWNKYGKRFEQGISMLAIHSSKGEVLFQQIKNGFEFLDELTQEEASLSNDNMKHPVKRPHERNNFYQDLMKKGYPGLWKRTYFTKTYRRKTLSSIYGAIVPAGIRYWLHKLRRR